MIEGNAHQHRHYNGWNPKDESGYVEEEAGDGHNEGQDKKTCRAKVNPSLRNDHLAGMLGSRNL